MSVSDRVKLVIATCFGLGYSPILPGTCGALIGIVNYVVVAWLLPQDPLLSVGLGVSLAIWTWITIALGEWAERYFAKKDSGIFVTDEVVGFLMAALLFHLVGQPWLTVAWVFPLVRVIDIVKVPPARRLEKLSAGWGVVADDLLAGLYTAGVLWVVWLLRPEWF